MAKESKLVKNAERARLVQLHAKRRAELVAVIKDGKATPEAKDAVRQKVTALFPAHEIERFTELFWERIQQWRAQGCP